MKTSQWFNGAIFVNIASAIEPLGIESDQGSVNELNL